MDGLTQGAQPFIISCVIQNTNQSIFRWWHGAIVFIVANVLSVIPAGVFGDAAFYNSFHQPWFAPADWVFAPVWLMLNVSSLVALGRVWNLKRPWEERRRFIQFEAAGWVLFAIFTQLYFDWKSPVLGAADTVAGLGVAIGSAWAGWRLDRLASAFVMMRVAWLALASAVSVYVAVVNPDPFIRWVR